jgi:hypothetical protein
MKLENYIKTKDKETILNFIKLCKEKNIEVENYENLDDSDTIGVGIFIYVPNKYCKNESIVIDSVDKVSACVCILNEEASWWGKLKLSNYESFIKNLDLEAYKTFLSDKLEQTKKKYPYFTIGCKMVSNIDIEYKFFGRNSYTPFILESYVYCSVTNKWGPKTQKGYGDFEGFKLWNEDYLKNKSK